MLIWLTQIPQPVHFDLSPFSRPEGACIGPGHPNPN